MVQGLLAFAWCSHDKRHLPLGYFILYQGPEGKAWTAPEGGRLKAVRHGIQCLEHPESVPGGLWYVHLFEAREGHQRNSIREVVGSRHHVTQRDIERAYGSA